MKTQMIAMALAGAGLAFAGSAGAQPTAEEAKAKFAAADTDHDGALSAAEWKAAGRRDRGFAMADADKDGKVTPEELRALMAKYRR
jgi:hypothetical protein